MSPNLARMATNARPKKTTTRTTRTSSPARTSSTKRMPVGRSRSASLSTLTLLVTILLLGQHALFDLARCEPALQQRGQSQTQQQSNELTGRQDSSQFSSGGDGANMGEGLAMLGANYRRGPYTNTKRARKMSAFMPMRGRKDGRDLVGSDSLRDFQPVRYAAAGQSALDLTALTGGGLVGSGSARAQSAPNQQLAQLREFEPSDVSLVRLFNGQAAIPPQFYNQVQSRSATSGQSVVKTTSGHTGGQSMESVGANGNQIMQAKLRRAFHPMRGKKAPQTAWTPTQLDDLLTRFDQLSLMLNGATDEF